jgi:hypothetical protein
MYGIINQSIQELILKEYGEETWLRIISKSGIDVSEFQNHEVYDDAYTYKLAISIAEVLKTDVETVLKIFGEFWITEISLKKYPNMMATGGRGFKDFMLNLPNFHNRVYLTYPELIAPEFKVWEDNESLLIEYHSSRNGLAPLMEGMIYGIIKMFDEKNLKVQKEYSKSPDGPDHDLFRILWEK